MSAHSSMDTKNSPNRQKQENGQEETDTDINRYKWTEMVKNIQKQTETNKRQTENRDMKYRCDK